MYTLAESLLPPPDAVEQLKSRAPPYAFFVVERCRAYVAPEYWGYAYRVIGAVVYSILQHEEVVPRVIHLLTRAVRVDNTEELIEACFPEGDLHFQHIPQRWVINQVVGRIFKLHPDTNFRNGPHAVKVNVRPYLHNLREFFRVEEREPEQWLLEIFENLLSNPAILLPPAEDEIQAYLFPIIQKTLKADIRGASQLLDMAIEAFLKSFANAEPTDLILNKPEVHVRELNGRLRNAQRAVIELKSVDYNLKNDLDRIEPDTLQNYLNSLPCRHELRIRRDELLFAWREFIQASENFELALHLARFVSQVLGKDVSQKRVLKLILTGKMNILVNRFRVRPGSDYFVSYFNRVAALKNFFMFGNRKELTFGCESKQLPRITALQAFAQFGATFFDPELYPQEEIQKVLFWGMQRLWSGLRMPERGNTLLMDWQVAGKVLKVPLEREALLKAVHIDPFFLVEEERLLLELDSLLDRFGERIPLTADLVEEAFMIGQAAKHVAVAYGVDMALMEKIFKVLQERADQKLISELIYGQIVSNIDLYLSVVDGLKQKPVGPHFHYAYKWALRRGLTLITSEMVEPYFGEGVTWPVDFIKHIPFEQMFNRSQPLARFFVGRATQINKKNGIQTLMAAVLNSNRRMAAAAFYAKLNGAVTAWWELEELAKKFGLKEVPVFVSEVPLKPYLNRARTFTAEEAIRNALPAFLVTILEWTFIFPLICWIVRQYVETIKAEYLDEEHVYGAIADVIDAIDGNEKQDLKGAVNKKVLDVSWKAFKLFHPLIKLGFYFFGDKMITPLQIEEGMVDYLIYALAKKHIELHSPGVGAAEEDDPFG